MRFLKFLASSLLTVGLIYALSNELTISGKTIPALGKLFNPFSGFWQNADGLGSLSFGEKPLILQGQKGNVSVVFDDRDVPHIFADSLTDAARAQGYIHAQNRLFQMDISARAAGGRLSEIIADERALENDKIERRHGMKAAAEASVAAWKTNPSTYRIIEAYAEGVNSYIATLNEKTLPVEYKILGFQPETWTPLHSALFLKRMCRTLARTEQDAEMSNSLAALGEADFQKLFPERHPKSVPIVPAGTKWNFAPVASNNVKTMPAKSVSDVINIEIDVEKEMGVGSNNWVVSGSKTASGKPILAGDPHLSLTFPSIWYECQITTPEINVYGVSLPCLPLIVIGFNNDIAWTQTNSQHDVADLYRMEWKDETKKEYKLDGKWERVEEHIEEYQVKGKGIIKDIVKWTKLGPIAYEDGSSARNDLAFHWLAADPNAFDITTFIDLAKAKNFDDFSNALKNYACPMQNYAFACKDGDIAIRTQGWLPIRQRGTGGLVSDGTSSANLWKGYVPFEQMPYVKNPSSGFAVSANQHTTDASYPYYYTSREFDVFRSRRLNQLLSEDKKFSIEDIRSMQYDCYGIDAEELLPVLLKNVDSTALNPTALSALLSVAQWDYKYTADSKAAMFYEAWIKNFVKLTWDNLWIKEKLNPYAIPKRWRTIQLLEDDKDSKHFDIANTPEIENGRQIAAKALNAAVEDIAKESALQLNPNLDYAAFMNTKISHIANFPGFDRKIHVDGHGDAVNATRGGHGPSWRMVVEMGDTPRAYVLYPGGQNGNPGSKTSEAFVDAWSKGEHYEAIFMKLPSDKNEHLKKTIVFQKQ
jgi:penicillin G amidase